jgi:hypothetical protein
MENYLRLLNPKTTNFDSIGGGNHGALTAQDVCVALSYAKLSPLQDNLVRLKSLNANTVENVDSFSKLLTPRYKFILEKHQIAMEYHVPVIRTALVEFCMVPASYKPSVRNRALFAGVNYLVVHRYLNNSITQIFDDLEREFSIACERVVFHIHESK